MKNVLAVLVATTTLGFTTSVFAADTSAEVKTKVDHKDNGGYESTSVSKETNDEGTNRKSKTTVDVDVDNDGTVSKTVESKTTTDPKGLLNSKKDVVKSEIEEKERGGYERTVKHDHVDNEGTNVSSETKTDVEVDADGKVTKTIESEKKTDPEGLLNSTKTTVKTKVVNGQVIEHKEETK